MDIVYEELTAGLPDMEKMIRLSIRLLTAMVLGAMIGLERERAGKAAGLRTHMLVSVGSALFVVVPLEDGMLLEDLSRIIQGIATGIGFVGAGSILKQDEQGQIYGLTTAAGIWLTSAVGVAAGMGRLGAAIFSVLLALLILADFTRIGDWMNQRNGDRGPGTGGM